MKAGLRRSGLEIPSGSAAEPATPTRGRASASWRKDDTQGNLADLEACGRRRGNTPVARSPGRRRLVNRLGRDHPEVPNNSWRMTSARFGPGSRSGIGPGPADSRHTTVLVSVKRSGDFSRHTLIGEEDDVAIAAVTAAELLVGVELGPDQRAPASRSWTPCCRPCRWRATTLEWPGPTRPCSRTPIGREALVEPTTS